MSCRSPAWPLSASCTPAIASVVWDATKSLWASGTAAAVAAVAVFAVGHVGSVRARGPRRRSPGIAPRVLRAVLPDLRQRRPPVPPVARPGRPRGDTMLIWLVRGTRLRGGIAGHGDGAPAPRPFHGPSAEGRERGAARSVASHCCSSRSWPAPGRPRPSASECERRRPPTDSALIGAAIAVAGSSLRRGDRGGIHGIRGARGDQRAPRDLRSGDGHRRSGGRNRYLRADRCGHPHRQGMSGIAALGE